MKSKMTISDAIEQWILIRLVNLPKELIGSTTGIYNPDGWIKARLGSVDELGVWLENPHFTITDFMDSEGNPIAPNQRKEVTKTAVVLIKWQFVGSIVLVEMSEAKQDQHSVRLGFRLPESQAIEEDR